jgi:two-component system, OmpR family, KDP operon response regulator KdpE
MSASEPRILLVDDDPGIMAAIRQALIANRYEVITADDGVEALESFASQSPNLVLLDLMMPRASGHEVCQRIRQESSTPIIVLSVKGSEADIVSVLDLGADDYLVKPFRLAELLARVRAVLRRNHKTTSSRVVCGELEIDTEQRRVSVAGQPVTLTPIEYALLAALAENPGRVMTIRQLLQRVWGPQYTTETDYVKGVIRRLRVKLEADPAHPRYIITEPHLGYRLNDTLTPY